MSSAVAAPSIEAARKRLLQQAHGLMKGRLKLLGFDDAEAQRLCHDALKSFVAENFRFRVASLAYLTPGQLSRVNRAIRADSGKAADRPEWAEWRERFFNPPDTRPIWGLPVTRKYQNRIIAMAMEIFDSADHFANWLKKKFNIQKIFNGTKAREVRTGLEAMKKRPRVKRGAKGGEMSDDKQKTERLNVFEHDDGILLRRGDGSVFIGLDELPWLVDGIREYLGADEDDEFDEEAELVGVE